MREDDVRLTWVGVRGAFVWSEAGCSAWSESVIRPDTPGWPFTLVEVETPERGPLAISGCPGPWMPSPMLTESL